MKRISIPLLLLLSVSLFAADTEPHFKSAAMPFYPPLARQARIEGKVTLRFTVNENGETADVEATSGHKLLRRRRSRISKAGSFGLRVVLAGSRTR